MPRSRRSQTKHDAEVRKMATAFKKQGFSVDADILGYSKPDTIGGYRPDIVAKKAGQRKIVEVETPDSVDSARDKAQQQAFLNAASRSKSTTFHRRIAE